jgi:hypothetical protein
MKATTTTEFVKTKLRWFVHAMAVIVHNALRSSLTGAVYLPNILKARA